MTKKERFMAGLLMFFSCLLTIGSVARWKELNTVYAEEPYKLVEPVVLEKGMTVENNVVVSLPEKDATRDFVDEPEEAIIIVSEVFPTEVIEDVPTSESVPAEPVSSDGNTLSALLGTVNGPSGKETFYNLDMSGIVAMAHNAGIEGDYWVRDDGVKMLGNYILAAGDISGLIHNRYDLVETSLGMAIIADTGTFAVANPYQIDIATTW